MESDSYNSIPNKGSLTYILARYQRRKIMNESEEQLLAPLHEETFNVPLNGRHSIFYL